MPEYLATGEYSQTAARRAVSLKLVACCLQVLWLATEPQCTGRRRTASQKAMACVTLALHDDEQAAKGQTARLRLAQNAKCLLRLAPKANTKKGGNNS